MNIFINLWSKILDLSLKWWKTNLSFDQLLTTVLESWNYNISEVDTVYVFVEKYDSSLSTSCSFSNVKIIPWSFIYGIKHLSVLGHIRRDSVIFTSSPWDYYFIYLGIEVHQIKLIWSTVICSQLTSDIVDKRYEVEELDQKYKYSTFIDYLFLQDKNEESVGSKKTVAYLNKYGPLEFIKENLEKIDEKKIKGILEYQIPKIQQYLFIKSFCLTPLDIA